MGKIQYLGVTGRESQGMVEDVKNWLEQPIMLTPKSIAVGASALVVGTISAYIWLFSTFVTLAAFNVHAVDFQEHTEAQTVWELEARLEDVGDKIFELKQRMEEPQGNNPGNRTFLKDLEGRQFKLTKQINCLQQNGRHCLRAEA